MGKSSRRPRLGAAEGGEIKPPAAARRRGRARGARSPVHRAPASRLHDDHESGLRDSCVRARSSRLSASVRPPPPPIVYFFTPRGKNGHTDLKDACGSNAAAAF